MARLMFPRNHSRVLSHDVPCTPMAFPCNGRLKLISCTVTLLDLVPTRQQVRWGPNVVLKICIFQLMPYLLQIYRAILKLGV